MQQREQAVSAMRDSLYGETVNTTLLELFSPTGRVLDIGCGVGSWAPVLRERGATHLAGVEIAPAAADIAATRYDTVQRDPVEQLVFTPASFETIIAADVLEHLVDPWSEIARWREWSSDGGQLVVSVPNLQSIDLLLPLIRGRFSYVDGGGMMDRTHLRWFTHASMSDALTAAGWHVTGVGRPALGKRGKLSRLTRGRFDRFLQSQIQIVARA